MEEIAKREFNYNKLDPKIAAFLKNKEDNMREVVGGVYTKLGKELKEAQDKLAGDNQHNGIFQEWYETLGFSKSKVYRMINRYELVVSNWEKRELIEDLPLSLSYEVSKNSADPELKKKVLDGDITSHKKYKELEKEKKELEKEVEKQKRIKEKVLKKKKEEENFLDYKMGKRIQNDEGAKKAEVIQGIRNEISKLRNSKGKIDELLNKDVNLDNPDLYMLSENADFLSKMANKIYDYIATQQSQIQEDIVDISDNK